MRKKISRFVRRVGDSFNFFRMRTFSVITAAIFVTSSAVLQGCTAERHTQFVHLKGTLAWKQGDWNGAVVHFCEAEDRAAELSNAEIRNYTDFALASAYLMQAEDEAAKEKLLNISETAAEILQSQRFYQQGIIAFRAKAYAKAAALFRKSLELSDADIEAKINYELSKKFCAKQREMQYENPQNAVEEVHADPTEDSIILDIIRKREQAEWKKMQHESEPSINDY